MIFNPHGPGPDRISTSPLAAARRLKSNFNDKLQICREGWSCVPLWFARVYPRKGQQKWIGSGKGHGGCVGVDANEDRC